MTDPHPLPPDIGPTRGTSIVLGVVLVAIAAPFAFPVIRSIQIDGLGRIGVWPDVFYGFAAFSLLMIGLGLRLILKPLAIGGHVRFGDGGFVIWFKDFLSSDQRRFEWSEVKEFGLVAWSNRSGYFIRRQDGREFSYKPMHFKASKQEFLDRLVASAKASGFHAEKGGLNLMMYEKQKWTIRPDQPD